MLNILLLIAAIGVLISDEVHNAKVRRWEQEQERRALRKAALAAELAACGPEISEKEPFAS